MRFKPPPPHSSIGWRVEFRPTEVSIIVNKQIPLTGLYRFSCGTSQEVLHAKEQCNLPLAIVSSILVIFPHGACRFIFLPGIRNNYSRYGVYHKICHAAYMYVFKYLLTY